LTASVRRCIIRERRRITNLTSSAAARAVIGIGLLLALTSTVGPLPSPGGEPGASLAIRLPDTVRMVVLGLLGLSVLILLAIQRPRSPSDDELLPVQVPRRLPPWVAALIPLTIIGVWYLIWQHWSGGEGHPIEDAFTAIAGLLELLALARKPPTSLPFFDLTLAVLGVLLAVTLFALMVLIAFADRLAAWRAGRGAVRAVAPVAEASTVDDGDLRAEPNARVAIVRAWGRFEHAVAGARAPRKPWQTPTEFMRATVARLPVPTLPVTRLTALFELARFSDRPLGTDARDAACDCLDEITAALTPPPTTGSAVATSAAPVDSEDRRES
jgi:hypothetical protein